MLNFFDTSFEAQVTLYHDVTRDKLLQGDVSVDFLQTIMSDDPTDSFSLGCRKAIDEFLGGRDDE